MIRCIVCGNTNWRMLPVPAAGRAITTSGVVLGESLEREQCMSCGLLRKASAKFIGNTRFYEEQYQSYYERPGAAHYDKARYAAIAAWMKSALGDFAPKSILDVGCGTGRLMALVADSYPGASIEGVEPSTDNAKQARRSGFVVYETRLGSGETLPNTYDLAYANNVFQHVIDPVSFLRDTSSQLSTSGQVVFILPDAEAPSNEMLWCDHNFSFRPSDFSALAKMIGFAVGGWQANPPDDSLLNKQLVVLRKNNSAEDIVLAPQNRYSVERLFELRSDYLTKWHSLDAELVRRIRGARRVFNFGASMWTWLLAGYCPRYWSRVEACLVDGEHGRCVDKAVIPPNEVAFDEDDRIVLGINPVNQTGFAEKLHPIGAQVVTWSDWIKN